MQHELWSCYHIALQYAKRYLPEGEWENCASDFRLHIRSKAGSDSQLKIWCETSQAYLNHCARCYVIDFARKLGNRRYISIYHRLDEELEFLEWDIPDFRNLPVTSLYADEFWVQIAALSMRLPKRSRDFLKLHYRHGFSHSEIASNTGLKVNAVSQILSRALKTIKVNCTMQGVIEQDFHPLSSNFAGGGRGETHVKSFDSRRMKIDM